MRAVGVNEQARGSVFGALGTVAIAALVLVGLMAFLLGCDTPRTTSPISKRPVTADELQAEVLVWQEDREAKGKAEIEEDARAMREAAAQSRRDAAKAKRDAERKLRSLDASAVDVREELLDVLAQIEQDFTLHAEAIQAGVRTRIENDAASERAMQAKADAAIADLNRQIEQRGAIWKLAKGGAQIAGTFVPGAQPAISAAEALLGTTGILGLAGTVISRIQLGKKKQELATESVVASRERQERERAQVLADAAKRKHEADLTAMSKVVDSLDHLKDVRPELGAILKTVDTAGRLILDEWQGPDGKALVNRLQQHAASIV